MKDVTRIAMADVAFTTPSAQLRRKVRICHYFHISNCYGECYMNVIDCG
jgi:hypothetical protein